LNSNTITMMPHKKRGDEAKGEEDQQRRERMDWVGSLLKDAKRLNFESRVRKVGHSSGMILLPGAWVGRRVKVNVELLD
jgi:putative transposon-encoded protein